MKRYLLALSVLLVSVSALFAGTTGKISGRVTEAGTGAPVAGANVVLLKTSTGAATDGEGYFSIINIPPGVYTVQVSMIGYQTYRETNVGVSVDRTTTVNASLHSTTVEVGAVEVVAERPDIIRDLTSTLQKVDARQIEKLPVENIGDLLRLQAGVTKDDNGTLHMRGGRSGELQYYVDGMPASNPFSGGLAVSVQNSSIEEMQVISGAFNAEYGRAMSGIMNIVTKEGGDRYEATFSAETGDFLSTRDNMFVHIKSMNPLAQQYYDGSLSGPVPLFNNKMHYFISGRYRKEENWLYGQRRYLPTDTADFRSMDPSRWTVEQSGDNAYVSLNDAEALSFQAKLTFNITDGLKLTYNGIYDKSTFRPYNLATDEYGSHRNMFNPGFLRTNTQRGLNNLFTLTHTISSRVFHELKASYYWTNLQIKARDNPYDPAFITGIHRYTNLQDNLFSVGGIDPRFLFRRSYTIAGKYELTAQVDRFNMVKVGGEYRQHKLQQDDFQVLRDESTNWQLTIPPTSTTAHDYYSRRPLEIAAYVQDKIEVEDFIVNAGVRFDYFNSRAYYPLDETDPGNRRGRPFNEVYAKATPKSQISPRLGLAFPISDNGNIHASYGQFFQIPEFDRMYENPDFEVFGRFVDYIGNANLDAQRTTVYEIGLQQKVAANLVLDATCYYKDYRNLAGTHLARTFELDDYGQYTNADYGYVWGVTLSLDVLKTGMLSGNVNYTYQVADGNGSDPRQAFLDALHRNEAARSLVPLNWDQRHVLNAMLSIDGDSWGISSINSISSGLPYTPATTFIPNPNVQLTNEGRYKPEYNMDLRAYKDIMMSGLVVTLYLSVDNVFDRSRIDILPQIKDTDLATHAPKARFNSLYDYRYDPGRQPAPRLVKAGLRFRI